MAYCRSNGKDSDVYLIGGENHLECFGAGWELEVERPVHKRVMVPDWENRNGEIIQLDTQHEMAQSFLTHSRSEMIEHLREHQKAGHKVPVSAFDRLEREKAQKGDLYDV